MATESTDSHDLVIERVIDVAPELVWAAWTEPDHLVEWFTPSPWSTQSAEIDLRPGGTFRVIMRSPEGEITDEGAGCVLEVEANRRFVWTAALGPGFRPNDFGEGGFPFTAEISMEPEGTGTRYRARVLHATSEHRDTHAEMGFAEGWNAALDQLVAHMGG